MRTVMYSGCNGGEILRKKTFIVFNVAEKLEDKN